MDINVNEVRNRREREGHDDSSRKQDRATTPLVHKIPWGDSAEDIDDSIDSGHKNSVAADPTGLLKNHGSLSWLEVKNINWCVEQLT